MAYTVVWFKRDLRVHDHAPLIHAARQGPVLCLYVLEPSLWAQPDCALQHYGFLRESLRDLALQLRTCGATLQLAVGEMPEVLAHLHALQPFARLASHEETGNAHTYARDLAVARWCRRLGVAWQEWPQHGVVRRLPSREQWHGLWQAHMQAPCLLPPLPASLRSVSLPWRDTWPAPETMGLSDAHDPPQRQRGGRAPGQQVLHDFLHARAAFYRGGISSPLTAPTACSRLSPYLALGCLGMREVVQATQERQIQLNADDEPLAPRQRQGLAAFMSRMHWHCHFIQKLESEPELEWRNLHRGYDGLREDDWNPAHFEALQTGRTGWPMVDACVAMLRATGWLNFRMRAMLMSFASYNLWLPWQLTGQHLARLFVDYEPGIHWPQAQMQSGSTGRNALRIYDPVKQALELDPHGKFVARWLPVLGKVPLAWRFEPWKMPLDVQMHCGVRIGHDYPAPCVPWEPTQRAAREQLRACQPPREARIITPAAPARRSRHQPPPQQLALGF